MIVDKNLIAETGEDGIDVPIEGEAEEPEDDVLQAKHLEEVIIENQKQGVKITLKSETLRFDKLLGYLSFVKNITFNNEEETKKQFE